MYKAIKDRLIQFYISHIIKTHHIFRQILFDYNNGNWDEMVTGADDDRTNGLVHVFLDQLLSHGKDQVLVIIVHTHEDTGYVMGMTSDKKVITRWFMHKTYEMADAFTDVSLWAREQQNYFIAKNKEALSGQGQ